MGRLLLTADRQTLHHSYPPPLFAIEGDLWTGASCRVQGSTERIGVIPFFRIWCDPRIRSTTNPAFSKARIASHPVTEGSLDIDINPPLYLRIATKSSLPDPRNTLTCLQVRLNAPGNSLFKILHGFLGTVPLAARTGK